MKGWFNKKFIHEDKIFDFDMIEIYNDVFQFRQKSDYDFTYTPTLIDVKEALIDSKKFIAKVKKIL